MTSTWLFAGTTKCCRKREGASGGEKGNMLNTKYTFHICVVDSLCVRTEEWYRGDIKICYILLAFNSYIKIICLTLRFLLCFRILFAFVVLCSVSLTRTWKSLPFVFIQWTKLWKIWSHRNFTCSSFFVKLFSCFSDMIAASCRQRLKRRTIWIFEAICHEALEGENLP